MTATNVVPFTPPPNDPEAEQSVLGAILVRPEVLDQVVGILDPTDFYAGAHGRIYQAMLDLYHKGAPVDLVTVSALLKERGQLEGAGSYVFLAGLSEEVGFATNAEYYAEIVKKRSLLRKAVEIGQNTAAMAQGREADPKYIAEFLESMAHDLREAAAGDSFAAYARLALSVEQFEKLDLPPKKSLLYPWLTEFQMLQVYGDRGSGKSFFILGAMAAVAEGVGFGPWPAGEGPAKCLFLDGELPAQDIQARIRQMGLPKDLLVLNNARVVEAGLKRISLRNLEWTDGFKRFLVDQKIRFWAADNLSSLATGAENAIEDWTPINLFFLDLRALGITSAFVHHAGKDGGQRGTSGREDNLDISVRIKASPDAHYVPGPKFTVTFQKNRLAFGKGVELLKPAELELEKDPLDPTGEIMPWFWTYKSDSKTKAQERKVRIMELLCLGWSRSKIAKDLAVDRSTVKRAIDVMIEANYLTTEEKLTDAGTEWLENNTQRVQPGDEDF